MFLIVLVIREDGNCFLQTVVNALKLTYIKNVAFCCRLKKVVVSKDEEDKSCAIHKMQEVKVKVAREAKGLTIAWLMKA